MKKAKKKKKNFQANILKQDVIGVADRNLIARFYRGKNFQISQ